MAKWLVKTEPSECGIEDFAGAPDKPIPWDGVRNYQARNFLRDMAQGDQVFIYHSSCKHIGIAGVATVVRPAYPDPTQFDSASPYFDARSSPDNPRWQAVDLVFAKRFAQLIPLDEIKAQSGLKELALVRPGNRLSVMPVSEAEWRLVVGLRR